MDLWYVYMRHEAQEKMNSKPTHKLFKLIFESLWMTKHKLEKKYLHIQFSKVTFLIFSFLNIQKH